MLKFDQNFKEKKIIVSSSPIRPFGLLGSSIFLLKKLGLILVRIHSVAFLGRSFYLGYLNQSI